jgi:hypothetical protein
MERQPINAARVSARSLVQTGSLVDLEKLCYHHMASNPRFMYDNVAPYFENLTRFMITQIAYHYTSISTNIITYVTTW